LKELNLQGPDATLIVTAARVHDIGKIGIPDMVLQKPGALTPDEWAIMQTHSDRGADLLARYPDFARGVAIVRHHHERWDGKGYPAGLKGYDIPFGARLMAVADSFDAMTSDRPYRPGMSVEKATQILHEGRGVQWDAALVDAFLRSIAVTKTLDAETQRLGDAEQETNLTQRRRDAETQKPKEVCA
jgi:HD-GYP domain-containing protein (c-di-GMP phosphodiesterase class II)